MSPLAIEVPPNVLDAIAERVAALLRVPDKDQCDGDDWPEWLSVETAARYLDISPERLRKLQARGSLPYYQEGPGCRVFFKRRELDDAMSELRAR